MAYSTGIMRYRVTILNRKAATDGKYGIDSDGVEWEDAGTVWAAVDFVRGLRAMHQGAMDVYGVIMVRMRYNKAVNERSRIVYDGHVYQVLGETLHVDRQENIVQFHAQMIINDKTTKEL